ncbi:hypothetical protein HanPSC8_Chr06g0243051 [Helianthus annuus]|nr:hypothetical protein HanPSC8_Chr06g0243051 [Helianthus annuus]
MSKLLFWSLWFGQFCHFSLNLKLFKSGSLWFAFFCHFSPKLKISYFFTVLRPLFCLYLQG